MLPRIRLALQKPHLLFITFVYIPFLYFQTAGYDGTALLFAPLGLFLLGTVFTGKPRTLAVSLNIITYLICIMVSHLYPQTVVPHSGPSALLIDLLVAAVLSFTGLSILAVYISAAFEDNRQALIELSLRDSLTGVYNRRFMSDYLHAALTACRQEGNSFRLLMLDIDNFKSINDTFGHGFGDQVLLACVDAMQGALRTGDIVVRQGGEEFVVILLPEHSSAAIPIADSICQTISTLQFPNAAEVTVSIGIAESQPTDTVDTLLDRVDRCMYYAKQAGGNQSASEKQLRH